MSTTPHTVVTYRALTGPELLAIVERKQAVLLERLRQSGKFDPTITYPNCQLVVTVQVHIPQMSDRDITDREIVDEQPLPVDIPATDLLLTETVAESLDNPADMIRHAHDLPVIVNEISTGRGGIPVVRDVTVPAPDKRKP